MQYTVIGYWQEDRDSFVEHVEADTVEDAIHKARDLDSEREYTTLSALVSNAQERTTSVES